MKDKIDSTFIIFNNEGETYDRYSAFNKLDKSIFGFSDFPFHPLGVGSYCGDFTSTIKEIESRPDLGKRIYAEDLNDDCIKFLIDRQ